MVATWPWTLAIAAIVALALAAPSDWPEWGVPAAAVCILVVSAWLGAELAPGQAVVTKKQADAVQYVVLAEVQGGTLARGRVVPHNPKAGFVVLALGGAMFIASVYWVLYGPLLWLAGIACGAYIGYLIHASTASSAPSPNP